MFKFFRSKNTFYAADAGHFITELPPLDPHQSVGLEYLAIPKRDIKPLVDKYIAAMESEESEKWCRCLWIIHDDDADVKPGHCRECGASNKDSIHDPNSGPWSGQREPHQFRGIRKRRSNQVETTCPVHTREGLISYFFEWAFTNERA